MDHVTLSGYADKQRKMLQWSEPRVRRLVTTAQLIVQKCEMISGNSSHPNVTSLNFVQMESTNSCLLGAQLLPSNIMDNALDARCDDLDRHIHKCLVLSTLSSSEPASMLQKSCTFFAAHLVQITHLSLR